MRIVRPAKVQKKCSVAPPSKTLGTSAIVNLGAVKCFCVLLNGLRNKIDNWETQAEVGQMLNFWFVYQFSLSAQRYEVIELFVYQMLNFWFVTHFILSFVVADCSLCWWDNMTAKLRSVKINEKFSDTLSAQRYKLIENLNMRLRWMWSKSWQPLQVVVYVTCSK